MSSCSLVIPPAKTLYVSPASVSPLEQTDAPAPLIHLWLTAFYMCIYLLTYLLTYLETIMREVFMLLSRNIAGLWEESFQFCGWSYSKWRTESHFGLLLKYVYVNISIKAFQESRVMDRPMKDIWHTSQPNATLLANVNENNWWQIAGDCWLS